MNDINVKDYTVWAGGAEVTDFYVSFDTATAIKNEYESNGYDDVIIEKVMITREV